MEQKQNNPTGGSYQGGAGFRVSVKQGLQNKGSLHICRESLFAIGTTAVGIGKGYFF